MPTDCRPGDPACTTRKAVSPGRCTPTMRLGVSPRSVYTLMLQGHWRSWLARLYDTQEVTGSSPVWPIPLLLDLRTNDGAGVEAMSCGGRHRGIEDGGGWSDCAEGVPAEVGPARVQSPFRTLSARGTYSVRSLNSRFITHPSVPLPTSCRRDVSAVSYQSASTTFGGC